MFGNGPRVAVEDADRDALGRVAGIDLGCAYQDSQAELAERLRGAAASITHSAAAADAVVAAVPDAWLMSGVEGAKLREVVRETLADEQRLPLRAIVGCAQAIAARMFGPSGTNWQPATGGHPPTMTVVICQAAEEGLRLARCELARPGATDLTVTLTGCHVGRSLPPAETFGSALAAALCTKPGVAASQDANGPAGAAVERSLTGPAGPCAIDELYAELGRRRKRLAVAIAAGERNPAFLEVPVAGLPGTEPKQWATAGEVAKCFDPSASAMTSAISAFIGDAPLPDGTSLIMTGPAAANPLVTDLLEREISHRLGGPGATFAIAGELAAAEGAASIAQGKASARLPATTEVRLPLHRVVCGRLRETTIHLPAAGHGGVKPAEHDGTPVKISIPEGAGLKLYLEIVTADGQHVEGSMISGISIGPGRYQVAWWPDVTANGILSLRPDSGAPAALFTLPADVRSEVGASHSTTGKAHR